MEEKHKMSILREVLILLIHALQVNSRPRHDNTISVNSGSRADLACDIIGLYDKDVSCHWLKDGWMLSSGGRHDVGDDCVLSISPVLPLDQGQYQCQVGGVRPVTSAPATLRVNTEPGQPVINTDDVLRVDRGEKMQLQCQSQGARPAADIEWWNADTGNRILSHVTNDVVKLGGSFRTVSTLQFIPESDHSIRCSAHSDQFPVRKYSDPVNIKYYGEHLLVNVSVGESVTLECEAGDAEDDTIHWTINSVELEEEHRDSLVLHQFVAEYDGAVVKCELGDKLVKTFELRNIVKEDREVQKIEIDEEEDLNKTKTRVNRYFSLYTCDLNNDENDIFAEILPSHVTITNNDDSHYNAVDDHNRSFSCQKFSNAKNKLLQMKNTMKYFSRKIMRFQRSIKRITLQE